MNCCIDLKTTNTCVLTVIFNGACTASSYYGEQFIVEEGRESNSGELHKFLATMSGLVQRVPGGTKSTSLS